MILRAIGGATVAVGVLVAAAVVAAKAGFLPAD